MIEQLGDWTMISSGSVEGYVKSDLLVFGEEAKHLYEESYGSQGTVTASSLRVRKEPSMDALENKFMPINDLPAPVYCPLFLFSLKEQTP